MGCWPGLRCALGNMMGGTLTPTVTPQEDGWRVSVRARNRLTVAQIQWIAGWFNGAAFAWGASPLELFPLLVTEVA
jgi:hypothetical protein